MGSEHSSHHNIRSTTSFDTNDPVQTRHPSNFRRQHTIANPGNAGPPGPAGPEDERPGSTSPGPSICSDTDLPYISYTVNRPIGDSPKLTKNKLKSQQQQQQARKAAQASKTPQAPSKKSAHNIVVVKAAVSGPNVDKDPDILRLQNIPMFLPIMRATLNLPAARDPEVLERLDPIPLQKLCARYQSHMHTCANLIATEQITLAQKVREVDGELARLVNANLERQKANAKHFEKLKKVNELSHQLNRCHSMLNQILESMEGLNNLLEIEERLEPFVWTTG